VKYFFDTSVLVAAVSVHHMHHAPSQSAYLASSKNNSSCAAHSLAEVYATLTRFPGKQRMSCEQALLVVDDIRQRLTTIALERGKEAVEVPRATTVCEVSSAVASMSASPVERLVTLRRTAAGSASGAVGLA